MRKGLVFYTQLVYSHQSLEARVQQQVWPGDLPGTLHVDYFSFLIHAFAEKAHSEFFYPLLPPTTPITTMSPEAHKFTHSFL